MKITQPCPTLCDPMGYRVHGILQARILEWVAFSFPGDLPNLGTEPRSPTLQADSLPAESPGKSQLSFNIQFSSVAQSCLTLCDPMNCSMSGLPVHHQLLESPKLMSIDSVMPSSHLILCRPLFLLPPIPPSIRVFSNESTSHEVAKVLEFQL